MVLFSAGDQVPVMPLVDVVGRAANVLPEHIGAIAEKAGMVLGYTVMVNNVVSAHCPGAGVKV